ncbi:MAG: hypothetical protein U9O97_07050, partial [Elusimicrobiota bacterium]|nr:hypothetical protein [Elusimicrobiota bacterium]
MKKINNEKILQRLLALVRSIGTLEYFCDDLLDVAGIYAREKRGLTLLREITAASFFISDLETKLRILSNAGILYAKLGDIASGDRLMSKSIGLAKFLMGRKPAVQTGWGIQCSCVQALKEGENSNAFTNFLLYYAHESVNLTRPHLERCWALRNMAEIYSASNQNKNLTLALDRIEDELHKKPGDELNSFILRDLIPLLIKTGQRRKALDLLTRYLDAALGKNALPFTTSAYLLTLAEGCAGAGLINQTLDIIKKVNVSGVKHVGKNGFFALTKIAGIYLMLGMTENAQKELNKCLPLIESEKSKNAVRGIESAVFIAERFLEIGDKAAAQKLAKISVTLSEKARRNEQKSRSQIALGNLFVKLKDTRRAYTCLKLAVAHAEKVKDDYGKSACCGRLADLYKA